MPELTMQEKMDQADYITDCLRRILKNEAVKGSNVTITLTKGKDRVYTETSIRPVWILPNGTWTLSVECNGGARNG